MIKEHKAQTAVKRDVSQLIDQITEEVAIAFRMDPEEKTRFMEKNIARLIAAIPFLADCEDAERTAVAHLGTYVLSCRETKHVFNATPGDNDSIFDRLRLINNFKGGDRKVIDKGMSLLALIMVTDYHRDTEIDGAIGKYNPVSDDSFDYETLEKELTDYINSVECVHMDEILNAGAGTTAYWGW